MIGDRDHRIPRSLFPRPNHPPPSTVLRQQKSATYVIPSSSPSPSPRCRPQSELLAAGAAPERPGPSQLVDVLDGALVCEAAWHEGHSLAQASPLPAGFPPSSAECGSRTFPAQKSIQAPFFLSIFDSAKQTVFTCLYLHLPDQDLPRLDPVLAANVRGARACAAAAVALVQVGASRFPRPFPSLSPPFPCAGGGLTFSSLFPSFPSSSLMHLLLALAFPLWPLRK